MIARRIWKMLIPAGILLCLLAVLTNIQAQQLNCSDQVKALLQQTADKCSQIGRNKACYGNSLVIATPNDGAQGFAFQSPGDTADVASIKSLRLAPLNSASGQWGTAYLHIQANLPDTAAGQYVTVLLFGDAALQNAGSSMQSVYFQTGTGSPVCHNSPTSGMIIQTPHGSQPVNFTVDGVQLGVSSTVFIQAPSNDLDSRQPIGANGKAQTAAATASPTMTPRPSATTSISHSLNIKTLQGHVTVTTNGYTATVSSDQETDVTLNNEGDQPSDNGDPIQNVITIDPQDNPDLIASDEVGDSLIDPLPTDEGTQAADVTDTPEITDTPEETDTPEVSDTPEETDSPEITDTPAPDNSGGDNSPTPEAPQPDDNQSGNGGSDNSGS